MMDKSFEARFFAALPLVDRRSGLSQHGGKQRRARHQMFALQVLMRRMRSCADGAHAVEGWNA